MDENSQILIQLDILEQVQSMEATSYNAEDSKDPQPTSWCYISQVDPPEVRYLSLNREKPSLSHDGAAMKNNCSDMDGLSYLDVWNSEARSTLTQPLQQCCGYQLWGSQ